MRLRYNPEGRRAGRARAEDTSRLLLLLLLPTPDPLTPLEGIFHHPLGVSQ